MAYSTNFGAWTQRSRPCCWS